MASLKRAKIPFVHNFKILFFIYGSGADAHLCCSNNNSAIAPTPNIEAIVEAKASEALVKILNISDDINN